MSKCAFCKATAVVSLDLGDRTPRRDLCEYHYLQHGCMEARSVYPLQRPRAELPTPKETQ